MWPGALGWTTNHLLLWAVGAELVITASFLFVPPVAAAMDQAPPTVWGWLVAVSSIPVMLAVDAGEKAIHRRRRSRDGSTAALPTGP